ncbi:hypothetical protein CPAV1605_1243 [seawater metagenome]|uniref:Uncharacterized protein n=1 Tax=seawater metagenome TaxID=1561972 RepID=A0A5E8CM79_9ZZZZ
MTSIFKYLKRQFKYYKNNEEVIFIDMPDPDNHMLAISLAKRLKSNDQQKISHLHIVATGHPVDFRLSRFNPDSSEINHVTDNFGNEKRSKMDFKKHVKEQIYEKDMWSKTCSEKLLLANIHTLEQLLIDAGIDLDKVTIYNGGIAERAGLSHNIHDYEEFFMNSDGEILDGDEYNRIVSRIFYSLPSKRREIREQWCDSKISKISNPILTLQDFVDYHQDLSCIKWYLAGPSTPLLKILSMSNKFKTKTGYIKAMAGAWEGKKNLLGGNFNEQVDWTAFKTLFCNSHGSLFENATVTLLTTETAKQDNWLCYNKEDINMILDNEMEKDLKIAELAELWAFLKPGDSFQPAFDLALSYDEIMIPFDLYRINLGIEKDNNAFSGERSKIIPFNLWDYFESLFLPKSNIYAYSY